MAEKLKQELEWCHKDFLSAQRDGESLHTLGSIILKCDEIQTKYNNFLRIENKS